MDLIFNVLLNKILMKVNTQHVFFRMKGKKKTDIS